MGLVLCISVSSRFLSAAAAFWFIFYHREAGTDKDFLRGNI